MNFSPICRLPCREHPGDFITTQLYRIPPVPGPTERTRTWARDVQPEIRRVGGRADAGWSWDWTIPALLFAGAFRRKPQLFQLTVGTGKGERPAAMIALLGRERWIEGRQPATYLWYVASAPQEALRVPTIAGRIGTPLCVGLAALDVAVVVSLNSEGRGRTWLHADPAGAEALLRWYGVVASACRLPLESFSDLPGDVVRGRRGNDGRYFAFTPETATWAVRRFNAWRG